MHGGRARTQAEHGMINAGTPDQLGKAVKLVLTDYQQSIDELDGKQFDSEAPSGLQAPAQTASITILPRLPDTPELQPQAGIDLMHHAIAMLMGYTPGPQGMPDAQWMQHVTSMLFPLEPFRGGFISSRIDSWRLYFRHFGLTTKTQQIYQWLEYGLDISWVPVDAPSQWLHPRYGRRLALVRHCL